MAHPEEYWVGCSRKRFSIADVNLDAVWRAILGHFETVENVNISILRVWFGVELCTFLQKTVGTAKLNVYYLLGVVAEEIFEYGESPALL